MTRRFLKTTTAAALVAALSGPLAAQDLLRLGNLAPDAAIAIIIEQRAAAEAEGNTARVAELDQMRAQIEAQMTPAPEPADVVDQAAPSAGPVDGSEPVDASDPVDAATPAAPDAEVAPEADVAAGDDAAPTADPVPAPVPVPVPAAEAEAAPVNDGQAVDADVAPATAPLDADLRDALEEAVGQQDAEAEAEAAAEAETEAAVEAEVEAEADTPVEAPEATAAEAEVVAPDPQAQADVIAEDDAATSAAAAAAAGDSAGAEPEIVEETVTEETARGSDEEFETTLQQGNAAAAQANASDDKDDDNDRQDEILRGAGAALLGLGALAVGDMLRPNEAVVSNTGDRIVVERDGQFRVLRNDDALLRQPGSNVTTYRYDDGSTRTVVVREDGSEIETILARDGRVLRRTRTLPSGESFVLFDDTETKAEVVVNDLPQVNDRRVTNFRDVSEDDLSRALQRLDGEAAGRTFSLNQVRNIDQVRKLMPEINVDTVNFETGSAVIRPEEAEELSALGRAIRNLIADNPSEVFLIEGHTDAVGGAGYNLALSDRRAESVALALSEYFDVPPENLVIQGYGESDLLIPTQTGERANRRAAVRRITPLLQASR
ncbi:OmpA family protein [Roseivivax sp. CAU 1753]